MTVPDGHTLEVRAEKVTDYLLNADHPDGRPKALFFLSNGLDRNNPSTFISLLKEHFKASENHSVTDSPFGTKYVIEGKVALPNGSIQLLRSIWIRESEQKIIKFVTAYRI